MFIMSSHPLCIHDIDSMHMHAIGVPEGVTLLEFKGTGQEDQQPPAQEPQVQALGEVPEDTGAGIRRSARRHRG
jgi:hypothetical protein